MNDLDLSLLLLLEHFSSGPGALRPCKKKKKPHAAPRLAQCKSHVHVLHYVNDMNLGHYSVFFNTGLQILKYKENMMMFQKICFAM